jgi:hypothetical protein
MLVDAFIPNQDGGKSLRSIAQMSAEDIEVVSRCFCDGLSRLLQEHICKLRTAFDVMDLRRSNDSSASSKFEVVAEMNCGSIEDFHKGLMDRTGTINLLYLVAAKPNVY